MTVGDPVLHNRLMEDWSRREWIRSQRPAALAGERMSPTVERQWNDWCAENIAIALRAHSKITQEFVVSLIRENNKNLMRVIGELRTEIDQLRKQLKEK